VDSLDQFAALKEELLHNFPQSKEIMKRIQDVKMELDKLGTKASKEYIKVMSKEVQDVTENWKKLIADAKQKLETLTQQQASV